jgi:hypothetical protein
MWQNILETNVMIGTHSSSLVARDSLVNLIKQPLNTSIPRLMRCEKVIFPVYSHMGTFAFLISIFLKFIYTYSNISKNSGILSCQAKVIGLRILHNFPRAFKIPKDFFLIFIYLLGGNSLRTMSYFAFSQEVVH